MYICTLPQSPPTNNNNSLAVLSSTGGRQQLEQCVCGLLSWSWHALAQARQPPHQPPTYVAAEIARFETLAYTTQCLCVCVCACSFTATHYPFSALPPAPRNFCHPAIYTTHFLTPYLHCSRNAGPCMALPLVADRSMVSFFLRPCDHFNVADRSSLASLQGLPLQHSLHAALPQTTKAPLPPATSGCSSGVPLVHRPSYATLLPAHQWRSPSITRTPVFLHIVVWLLQSLDYRRSPVRLHIIISTGPASAPSPV